MCYNTFVLSCGTKRLADFSTTFSVLSSFFAIKVFRNLKGDLNLFEVDLIPLTALKNVERWMNFLCWNIGLGVYMDEKRELILLLFVRLPKFFGSLLSSRGDKGPLCN